MMVENTEDVYDLEKPIQKQNSINRVLNQNNLLPSFMQHL